MGPHLLRRYLPGLAVFLAFSAPKEILEKSNALPWSKELIYWNVGQGDFITYVSSSGCVFFDVGGSIRLPERTLLFLKSRCERVQTQMFISHFDKDHISNYKRLLKYVKLNDAYFSHLEPRSEFGKRLLRDLNRGGVQVHEIRKGYFQKKKDNDLYCLWPPVDEKLRKAENDRSLVLKLKVSNKVFMFMGDLPSKLEKKLLEPAAEVLKAGHHGSKYSSSTLFLDRVRPQSCIVSVGRQNKFGHPADATLLRLKEAHCAILRTDLLGDIHFGL